MANGSVSSETRRGAKFVKAMAAPAAVAKNIQPHSVRNGSTGTMRSGVGSAPKFVNAVTVRGATTNIQPNRVVAGLGKSTVKVDGGASTAVSIWTQADRQMQLKWNALSGNPGAPKVVGLKGVIPVGDGFYREYAGGRIYYHSDIGAFWVYGHIGNRYTDIGGPSSWLGFPTSDEDAFFDGRGSKFQNGAIYWWPDTGAIELGEVVVTYSGLACFGETDEGSASDEPYVLFGVVSPFNDRNSAPRTRIYEDVDGGDSREDDIELYRGLPYGLSLSAMLFEHDLSDPDKYRETVEVSVEQASNGAAAAIALVPYVGPFIAPVAKAVLKAIGPDVVEFFNDLIGGEDDFLDDTSFMVSPKDMVRLTRVERNNFRGIMWHQDSPLMSGGGASYKVYISVRAV